MTGEREEGRGLDCEIAEKVFGCAVTTEYPATIGRIPVCGCRDGNGHGWRSHASIPRFSADIAAAFSVVEAMRAKCWWVDLCGREESWTAWFYGAFGGTMADQLASAANTLPLAICEAALAALDHAASQSAVETLSPETHGEHQQ